MESDTILVIRTDRRIDPTGRIVNEPIVAMDETDESYMMYSYYS